MGGPGGTVREAFDRALRRLADPSLAPEGGAGPRLGARTGPVPASLRPLLPVDPVPAAVLVAFVDRGDDPGILLTVRAAHLRKHAGQISFPGGRIEPGDADPAAAAMREAQEEIGLAPQGVTVVGQLPDQIVLTGFRITPVVALVQPEFSLLIDESEVTEVFEIPLDYIVDERNYVPVQRRLQGVEVTLNDLNYNGRVVWGATAGMLQVLHRALQAQP